MAAMTGTHCAGLPGASHNSFGYAPCNGAWGPHVSCKGYSGRCAAAFRAKDAFGLFRGSTARLGGGPDCLSGHLRRSLSLNWQRRCRSRPTTHRRPIDQSSLHPTKLQRTDCQMSITDTMTGDFHTDLKNLLPRLRVYALSLTHDPDRANDLVQDTVVKSLAGRHSFQPGTNFGAWLFRIQRNEFISGLRRQMRTVPLDDD